MIQLVFEADEAAAASRTQPVEVGYSQHEGAERADWGDEKLEAGRGLIAAEPTFVFGASRIVGVESEGEKTTASWHSSWA
jgi:hypothetical protein